MSVKDIKITEIKGIGQKRAQAFHRLGIDSVHDLVFCFPARYEDRSVIKKISQVEDGESVCIKGIISDIPRLSRIRAGMEILKFRVFDETGTADISYFNQSYLKNTFFKGDEYRFYGKFSKNGNVLQLTNPVHEKAETDSNFTGAIVPIYRMCAGLSRKNISDAVKAALSGYSRLIPGVIPDSIAEKYSLISLSDALNSIHFPVSLSDLAEARKRLIFEELFGFCCAIESRKGLVGTRSGLYVGDYTSAFISLLPFPPTGAQLRAISECVKDMSSGNAMSRLVQGDVGSGKTTVAAAAIYNAFRSGIGSAFMVPTEILAEQHYSKLSELFRSTGMKLEKLTGSVSAAERRRILLSLSKGETDLVIGTHSLFSENVEYSKLGLVITDEQHRFGVGQRAALVQKGGSPHVLVMSATPIPRTLALILYGDLDVSVIDELPPGRKRVDTFVVNSSYRARLNSFILKQAREGHQVFIVCPKVEDIEVEDGPAKSDLHSAVDYARGLSAEFPSLRVGCVHGRLSTGEKESVMAAFSAGSLDVLVATTVVEVGVDVPNASLMIIENAERFGLSQLHQLRGRVGRGSQQSWCVLVSDAEGDTAKARLKAIAATNDDFEIAREDLLLRGPGEFFGSQQHGLPELRVANPAEDMELYEAIHKEAQQLMRRDPGLVLPEHGELAKAVKGICRDSASTFN